MARKERVASLSNMLLHRDLDDARLTWLPTPEEIAAECESIRSRWSYAERRQRYLGRNHQRRGPSSREICVFCLPPDTRVDT